MGAFSNGFKTVILLALLTAVLLWVGDLLGGFEGLIVALFFVLLMNLISFWFSDKIVLKMYKAEELPPSHEITKLVWGIAARAQMPVPRVYLVPSATPNAFATGRSPKKAAVAVTRGITELLSKHELEGVIAHELSHIKNRDTLTQTVAAVIAGAISYVAVMARWGAIFGGFGGGGDRDGGGLIELLALMIVTPIVATLLQLALSRTREYAADASAARMLNSGQGLASALMKLELGNRARPMRSGNPSTAPLFIINPFRGRGFLELLSTHPPIEKRVDALKSLPY